MALQDTSSDGTADNTATVRSWIGALSSALSIQAVGFWVAVSLPVPIMLLLAGGVSTRSEFAAVSGLLTANLLALYLGRGYSVDDS